MYSTDCEPWEPFVLPSWNIVPKNMNALWATINSDVSATYAVPADTRREFFLILDKIVDLETRGIVFDTTG